MAPRAGLLPPLSQGSDQPRTLIWLDEKRGSRQARHRVLHGVKIIFDLGLFSRSCHSLRLSQKTERQTRSLYSPEWSIWRRQSES